MTSVNIIVNFFLSLREYNHFYLQVELLYSSLYDEKWMRPNMLQGIKSSYMFIKSTGKGIFYNAKMTIHEFLSN